MKHYKIQSDSYIPETVKELLVYLFKPYKRSMALFFFLTFIGTGLWTASTYIASKIINQLAVSPNIDSSVWTLVIIFSVFRIMDELFWRIAELYMRSFKPQMVERLRSTLFKGVTRRSHDFFVNSSSGRVSHWINTATQTFDFFVDTTIWTVWSRVIGMLIATVFLFMTHWSIGLIFITWLVLLFSYNVKRGKKFAQLVELQSDEQSRASGLIVDTISNNLTMRVFNSRVKEVERLSMQQHKIISTWRDSWGYNIVTNAVKGQSAAAVNIFALLLSLWLFSAGTIELGGLVLFLAYFSDASSSLWQLAWALDEYYRQFGRMQNALDGLNGKDEREMEINDVIHVPESVDLELKGLSFAYPEQPNELILSNLNLHIESGQKVGIVGHSGAGKSTLIGLLLGFYDPSSGEILVNDINIMRNDPSIIRSISAYVPQDTTMFNRSIRENVMYAKPDASAQELKHALEQARALEFVEKLPKGLDTLVGERGVKLSGGQRQRIAIARAILKDSPLLLLDEATSALDSVSEQAIQKALHELMKGRTAVVIAHRLSTLKHLDKIVVIEKGKIAEMGSHDELLNIKDGIYADLWKRQKDGFIVE